MSFVLLHGLGADRRQPLDLFGPALATPDDASIRVVAPDVRAHGTSTVVGDPADFELDRLADEVAARVVAELGSTAPVGAASGGEASSGSGAPSRPVTIVGISMGAAIALRIALRGLLPVERAVFVRPAFGDASLPPNLRAFPVIGELLREHGPHGGAERFVRTEPYLRVAEASPLGARGLLTQFQATDAARRAIRLVEIPRNRAFESDAEPGGLARRGIRSLVVGAPRDPVHPFELAERWAADLGAEFARVPARDDGQAAQTTAMREVVGRWLSRS
ncbi:alpha/beta fold hydrolase [Agromyces sp. M3QZ16-3]|uniref:alpha/beta fold hydrolase n=1 Tax=Agromyces sp. M3QZ16-3 TaxID=3447585 RepID=UPI003F68E8B1